ncbi:hypothetical protein VX159_03140 [Dechloromonas sp. ZY10]
MKFLLAALRRPEILIALWLSWSLSVLAWLAYRDAWLGTMCVVPR